MTRLAVTRVTRAVTRSGHAQTLESMSVNASVTPVTRIKAKRVLDRSMLARGRGTHGGQAAGGNIGKKGSHGSHGSQGSRLACPCASIWSGSVKSSAPFGKVAGPSGVGAVAGSAEPRLVTLHRGIENRESN
jgi:hypothetical protein